MMKLSLLFASAVAVFLPLAAVTSAQDYDNARVAFEVVSPDSLARFNHEVGTIRLLRESQDSMRAPKKESRRGKVTVSEEELSDILDSMGHPGERRAGDTMVLPTTLVMSDTIPHVDAKLGDDGFDDDEEIVIMFLEDVPGAYFQVGDDKIPVEANKMVFFKGHRMLHNTVVPRGREVRLLGPFASRFLEEVEGTDCDDTECPTVEFTEDNDTSSGGCCFAGSTDVVLPDACDQNTPPGDCCVDEGGSYDCGLQNSPGNNCAFFNERTMRAVACPTDPPTKGPTSSPTTSSPTSSPTTSPPSLSPTSAPTTLAPTPAPTSAPPCKKPNVTCKPGLCFDALAKSDCPSKLEYLHKVQHKCTSNIEMGQLCQSEGECGTDQHVADNCKYGFHLLSITLDVYRRVECCDDA